MKKSGFTLVELIAVIVVLALLMTIAFPAVLKAREAAEESLSREQIKNIKDSARMLGVDLDDYMTDIFNCKSGSWISNQNTSSLPYCVRSSDKWQEVKVTVEDLINHNYFKDSKKNCSGTVTVSKGDGGKYYEVVLGNDVKCE